MRGPNGAKLQAYRTFTDVGLEVDDVDRRMPRGLVRDGVWVEAAWTKSSGLRYRLIRDRVVDLRGIWHATVHEAMRDAIALVDGDLY